MNALLSGRWLANWPLYVLGAVGVISGGLLAAAIAPAPTEHGAWAAAYLVLVVGVAQIALSVGQAALSPTACPWWVVVVEAACWNVANALVITGTVANLHTVVYAGGALLALALAMFAYAVRGDTQPIHGKHWPVYAFRALVGLLLVSIPIGLVLATVRSGS